MIFSNHVWNHRNVNVDHKIICSNLSIIELEKVQSVIITYVCCVKPHGIEQCQCNTATHHTHSCGSYKYTQTNEGKWTLALVSSLSASLWRPTIKHQTIAKQ